MPELPEVEVTRRGIAPFIEGAVVEGVIVRNRRLRWPVPKDLERRLRGTTVRARDRRAKCLLFLFDHGPLIVHLGMSGSLRVVEAGETAGPWDHFDLVVRPAAQAGKPGALRPRAPRRVRGVPWHPA